MQPEERFHGDQCEIFVSINRHLARGPGFSKLPPHIFLLQSNFLRIGAKSVRSELCCELREASATQGEGPLAPDRTDGLLGLIYNSIVRLPYFAYFGTQLHRARGESWLRGAGLRCALGAPVYTGSMQRLRALVRPQCPVQCHLHAPAVFAVGVELCWLLIRKTSVKWPCA